MIRSTHYILDFTSAAAERLANGQAFAAFVTGAVRSAGLTPLGHAAHTFDTGGFTLALCLAESHLCLHTWPEKNTAAFDIFVSNHNAENRARVEQLAAAVKAYFDAVAVREQYIERF